jgi:hypothetical protein
MAEVIALTDTVVLPERASETVIESCRNLLEMAERGEIVGIAYVTVNPAGVPVTDWAVQGIAASFVLVGGLARLLWRMNRDQE